ncbi:hypothetical protein MRX96_021528 [Rhipicephalus microplus]
MSNPEREFRTRHKFGAKKMRRTLVANFKKRSMIQQNPRDTTLSASHGEVVDATMEGLAITSVVTEPVQSPSAAQPSSSSRVRLDTIYRQQSGLEEERAKSEDKLSLLSTAATEQKRAFVVDGADEAARPPDGTTFTIIDLDTVGSALLTFSKLKACNGELQIIRDDREFGLAVKLHFVPLRDLLGMAPQEIARRLAYCATLVHRRSLGWGKAVENESASFPLSV